MKQLIFSLELITGFVVGVEWVPKGTVDEYGYIAFDIGILRFMVSYD